METPIFQSLFVRLIAEDVEGVRSGRLLESKRINLSEHFDADEATVIFYELESPGKVGGYRMEIYKATDCNTPANCVTEANQVGTMRFQVTGP